MRNILLTICLLLLACTAFAQRTIVYPPHGGSGDSTVPAYSIIFGNGTLPFIWLTPGDSNFVLTSKGPGLLPYWKAVIGGLSTVYGVAPIVIHGGDTVTIGTVPFADSTLLADSSNVSATSHLLSPVPIWNQNTSGNAGTVTNGVYTTGSYSDPAWITNINYSILDGIVPTWNQNTTGTALNVSGIVAIANGGTGQVTAQAAIDSLTNASGGTSGYVWTTDATNGSWQPIGNFIYNQDTGIQTANFSINSVGSVGGWLNVGNLNTADTLRSFTQGQHNYAGLNSAALGIYSYADDNGSGASNPSFAWGWDYGDGVGGHAQNGSVAMGTYEYASNFSFGFGFYGTASNSSYSFGQSIADNHSFAAQGGTAHNNSTAFSGGAATNHATAFEGTAVNYGYAFGGTARDTNSDSFVFGPSEDIAPTHSDTSFQFVARAENGFKFYQDTSDIPTLSIHGDSIYSFNTALTDSVGQIIPASIIPGTNSYVLTTTGGVAGWQPASSGGVTTFNTRTGAVTLSAADVNGVGAITNSTAGNAGTVTNGVYTTGSYSDPAWITHINYSILDGTVPTWNQNTSGSAATLSPGRTINGVAFDGSTNVTVTAAAGTLTGTTLASGVTASSLTSFGASIALGTPASGTLTNCTFPTLNQNTTGSAATLTTPRAIYGNNFDGSAALTQIIASTYGGTGNGFTKFSGPATAEKTFTLPNASASILTDNAAVTIGQGGTGLTSTSQNFAFIGPTSGSGAPTWRALVAGDIPTLNQNTTGTALNVSGIVAIANGGTGQITAQAAIDALTNAPGGTSGYVWTTNATNGSWQPASGGLSNPMTTTGDIIYASSGSTPARRAGNTNNYRRFLRSTASAGVATAPVWDNWITDFGLSQSVFVGGAGNASATGTANTAIGAGTMNSAFLTGTGNTAIGEASAVQLSSGSYNTAIGQSAFDAQSGFSANYSIAIGIATLGNPGSDSNIAIGTNAMSSTNLQTTTFSNIAIGSNAMNAGTLNGTGNIAIGSYALNNIAAGSYNIGLGYGAGVNSPSESNTFEGGGNDATGHGITNWYFGDGVRQISGSTPDNVTLNATGGQGTNIAGANLNLAGGVGTGTGAPGSVAVEVSTAGSTGTTAQTLSTIAKFTTAGDTIFANGIGTAKTPGFVLANTTASTSGATVQAPPPLFWDWHQWSTTATTHDSERLIRMGVVPTSGTNPPLYKLVISSGNANVGYTDIFRLSQAGIPEYPGFSGGFLSLNVSGVMQTGSFAAGDVISSAGTNNGPTGSNQFTNSGGTITLGHPTGNTGVVQFVGATSGSGTLSLTTLALAPTLTDTLGSNAGMVVTASAAANGTIGTGTLSGGTVTISSTAILATSKVFLTDLSGGTNVGNISVGTVSAGSFVANSTNVLDDSSFNWWVVNP